MGRPNPAAPGPGEGLGADPDETTRADTQWPVAPLYEVSPGQDLEGRLADEQGVTPAQSQLRPAFPGGPAAAVVAAALALLLLLGAGTAWLVTRPDTASTAPPSPGRSGGPQPGTRMSSAPSTATETATSSTTGVTVPDVVGLSASDAARSLRDMGLEVSLTRRTSHRPPGTVLGQDPSSGAKVESGLVVALVLSKRAPTPAPTTVSLPRLVGTTAAAAKSRLRGLGLHWSVVEKVSERAEGAVIAQSPSAGTRIAKGKTVRLTVSSGPAQVSVPDVTGLDAASARAQLEAAGFDVDVVDQPTSDESQDGLVVDQDPAGGTDADKGSVVTITVARAA